MSKKETHMKSLFRKTIWFNSRKKYNIDFFDIFEPQRIVSEHHRYKSGVFFSEKCNREIQYESGIELAFIKQLEQSKSVEFYFEQPVQITYLRGRRKCTYTPDFAIFLQSKEVVLVEIKTLTDMLDNRVQMKIEGLLSFCQKKGFGLLFTDGRYAFNKIVKTKCNRKFEKSLLNVISDKGSIRKTQCREIMKECGATHPELLKAIVRHNLRFRSRTFKIEYGNQNEVFRRVFVDKVKYDDILEERYQDFIRRTNCIP